MSAMEFELGLLLAVAIIVAFTMAPAYIEHRKIKKLKKKTVRPYLGDR